MRPVYGANNRFVHRKGYVIQKSALNGLYGSWPSVPPMFDKRLLLQLNEVEQKMPSRVLVHIYKDGQTGPICGGDEISSKGEMTKFEAF